MSFDPAGQDGSGDEGDLGTTTVTYKLELSALSGKTVTVPVDFSGTASQGGITADYSYSGVPVVFAPGEGEKLITLSISGDLLKELDETIDMDIANNAQITNATRAMPFRRTHTIVNDDDF